MPLKALVKVGSITNLSDARYCAGMGADMLGFNVVPGTTNFVPPSLYQDIRGWISGPAIVVEVHNTIPDSLTTVVEQYAPAYIETDYSTYQSIRQQVDLPFIVAAEKVSDKEIDSNPSVAYWIVDSETANLVHERNRSKLLVRVTSSREVKNILSGNAKPGIALTGSNEIRAGFKDYDELSDIFDLLED
jgi:phosphoribosylanthranilate isomerase